jgi:AAA family ATP:ADP antiporter
MTPQQDLSAIDRLLSAFTRVRAGEGRSVALFFVIGFDFMFCQWVLKPVREAMLGEAAGPTIGTYATAVQAALLMALIPAYSVLFKRQDKTRLVQIINLFMVACLLLFIFVGERGLAKGFAFYVWVGLFSAFMIAQFWAFAADKFNVKSGQRLFAVLAAGVSLGAWIGSVTQSYLIERLGMDGVLVVVAAILALPVLLMGPAARSIPEGSRALPSRDDGTKSTNFLGGFSLIARDAYLQLIAAYVVLQNFIDTTGDYIIRVWIFRRADELVTAGECADKGVCIGALYGDFYGWVNLITLLSALFLVSRLINNRHVGMRRAVMIVPPIMVLGYAIIAFVPVFTVIRLVKIVEKSANYSLNNTVRAALFLPTSEAAKYEGRTTIDTFFWRFGDLLTAGVVFLGVDLLGWEVRHMALLNMLVAGALLWLAFLIGRHYSELAVTNVTNTPPEAGEPIPDLHATPGQPFRHRLPVNAFVDADPGDVLELSAQLADGSPLPGWLRFDRGRAVFHGTLADEIDALEIRVTASDVDGASADSVFRILRHPDA